MSFNAGRLLDNRTQAFLNQLIADEVELPDALAIQDLPAWAVSSLMERFPHVAFAPMTNHFVNGERMVVGIALFSARHVFMTNIVHTTYWGDGVVKDLEGINDQNERYLGEESDRMVEATEDRILITATLQKGDDVYDVATTHGMWTRGGITNDVQRQCMVSLRLELMLQAKNRNGLIFVGDFNAGRGTEMYQYLTEELVDHVPPDIETTLDPEHKASKRGINVVTDFVMEVPDPKGQLVQHVSNFLMLAGVSDHQVIMADLQVSLA
jgi:hypothetical protein